jgi:hypothetical protein
VITKTKSNDVASFSLTSLFLVITLSAYYNRHKKKMDLDLNLTPREENVQQPQEEDVQQPQEEDV